MRKANIAGTGRKKARMPKIFVDPDIIVDLLAKWISSP
jgi:hypothetical protein